MSYTHVAIPADETLEGWSPQDTLAWTFETFGKRAALASSFGAEDVVLIDMMVNLDPKARVFTLDTGRLNQETYDVMDRVRERYGIEIEVMFPEAGSVQELVRTHGLNCFYQSVEMRKACCGIRKVEPLGRALSELDAWITGLRRDQNVTRSDTKKVEVDLDHHGMHKINPLTDWTGEDIWAYIRENDVPYNALHDRGLPSIGCEPCTRAVEPGEDERAGRWWWENPDTKECGLHVHARG
jgi:phosphoadenosine phosphosulfate reductase